MEEPANWLKQEKEGDLLPVGQTEAMPSAGLNNGSKLRESVSVMECLHQAQWGCS